MGIIQGTWMEWNILTFSFNSTMDQYMSIYLVGFVFFFFYVSLRYSKCKCNVFIFSLLS